MLIVFIRRHIQGAKKWYNISCIKKKRIKICFYSVMYSVGKPKFEDYCIDGKIAANHYVFF